jgi:hypothetical protein
MSSLGKFSDHASAEVVTVCYDRPLLCVFASRAQPQRIAAVVATQLLRLDGAGEGT